MTLTRGEQEIVLAQSRGWLVGSFIQQIRVPDADRILLGLRRPGETRWLLGCSAPRLGRLHFVTRPPPNPRTALPVQGLLRKELKGTIVRVEQLDGERITRLVFEGSAGVRTLVLELYGGGGNIALLDGQDRVLGRAGSPRRPGCAAGRGEPWVPPSDDDTWSSAELGDRTTLDDLEERYARLEVEIAEKAATRALRRRIQVRRKELRKLRSRRERDLARAGSSEELRRRAELLRGSFHLLRKGSSSVHVIDWAAEGQPEIEVALDPALEPSELVARAIGRARRAERAENEGARRLAETVDALAQVDELSAMLDDAPHDALELADELLPAPRRQAEPGRRPEGRPFLAWRTPSGHELRVGRSAAENDRLTMRLSKGNDVWLHVRGRPGAHVIIRDPGKSPSPELLLLGAQLALVRSGLANGEREEVTWTRVKHVNKPKGSKPGSVVATQDRVLYVEVDRSALDSLTRV